MAEEPLTIRIPNWEKYNPRKDVANPRWFALQHSIFEKHEVLGLSPIEFRIWVYFLCLASKSETRGTFRILLRILSSVLTVSEKEALRAIKKLESFQLIAQPTSRGRYVDVTRTFATLQDNTEQDRTEQNTLAQADARASVSFDFESVYRDYPRKVGKAKGLKICKAQIRTEEDFEALKLAVEHYLDYCTKNATEVRFIKHFSTFMGEWRDWLDADAGSGKNLASKESEWIKQMLEAEKKHDVP